MLQELCPSFVCSQSPFKCHLESAENKWEWETFRALSINTGQQKKHVSGCTPAPIFYKYCCVSRPHAPVWSNRVADGTSRQSISKENKIWKIKCQNLVLIWRRRPVSIQTQENQRASNGFGAWSCGFKRLVLILIERIFLLTHSSVKIKNTFVKTMTLKEETGIGLPAWTVRLSSDMCNLLHCVVITALGGSSSSLFFLQIKWEVGRDSCGPHLRGLIVLRSAVMWGKRRRLLKSSDDSLWHTVSHLHNS